MLFWISLWTMELGLQALIACGLVSSFFPIPLSGFLKGILPFFYDMVRPEREIPLYVFFVAATAGIQCLVLWFCRGRMADREFLERTKRRVILGAGCLVLQLIGVFHIFAHQTIANVSGTSCGDNWCQDPPWARVLLYVGMGLFIVANICAEKTVLLRDFALRPFVRYLVEAAAVGLTVLMLYVPDQEAATARIYMGDQFHHFDQCVVGPAWAVLAGDVLNVDVISQYGLGMSIMCGHAANVFGGGYTAFFTVFMTAALIYFLLWYWLLRAWLKSAPLACAGVWAAIKIQMFHPGVFPFALTYPSATVVRFFWDIVFFILMWLYLSKPQKRWLAAAGVCAGLAVFYMSSTGLCLGVTFYAFLAGQILLPQQRRAFIRCGADVLRLAGYALLVPLTAIVLLVLAQGKHLFAPQFWHNIAEFNNYFLSGFGTIPIYESLTNKNFWAFWMGITIPMVYLWTVIFLGALLWAGRAGGPQLLAVLLSVYGLGLYHYYIARSAPTSFYTVAVPFVAVVCFWVHTALSQVTPRARAWGLGGMAGAALVLLWTNVQFAAYPNVFNALRHYDSKGLGVLPLPDGRPYFNHGVIHTARIPAVNSLGQTDEGLLTEADFKNIGELKSFFHREFDFTPDARLIDSLTAPGDKVALISSFDVRILMQAKRRPFFYHYPFFLSRPMRMRAFAVPAIYTVDQLKRTIGQMEQEKPEYVFIERIYSKDNTAFADHTNALQWLLLYVHTHYDPAAQGQYLMALKRRAP